MRKEAAAAGLVLTLAAWLGAGAPAWADTPTKTVLTGGIVRYVGSATADRKASDRYEADDDHSQGTFDESWLVSPYQRAIEYRNSLTWTDASGSRHDTFYDSDGKVTEQMDCEYGLRHAGGNGTVDIDLTKPALTVMGLQGAIVDQPNADCVAHGIRQDDLTSQEIALWTGTKAVMHLPTEPPTQDAITLPVAQSGPDRQQLYTTAAQGTVTLSCALCVTAIDFRQPDLPTGDMEDVPIKGTYDGNQIEIDVTVENRSAVDLTVPATLEVKDGPVLASDTLTAPAGSTTKIVYTKISTQGFAWQDGAAKELRTIEYLTPYGGGARDLPVRPKPLVLVHGLNSDASTWSAYQGFATAEHGGWDTFAVGDGQAPGVMNTDGSDGNSIATNAHIEDEYVEGVRNKTDAQHVDLVVHSMGGLISRQYIQDDMPVAADGKPAVAHLVMLGTPNQGSPCADIASLLPSAGEPYLQLRPDWVTGVFDQAVTSRRGVPFSIAAGNPLSFTCQSDEDGDGVVEVPSAFYQYVDHALFDLYHTSMTGSETLFRDFVKPHLAAGPSPAARPAAAAPAPAPAPDADVAVERALSLAAGGSDTVALPVAGASALEFVFAAPASVAAVLVDPAGAVALHQDAGSADAQQPIRTLRADAPATGTWTLRLTQTGADPAHAEVAGALIGDPLRLAVTASQPDGGGPVTVSAALTDAGTPVPGAAVTAQVSGDDGSSVPLTLAAAGDGGYRATTGSLAPGYHLAVVKAVTGQATRIASASAIGAATAAQPPAGGGGGGTQPGPVPGPQPQPVPQPAPPRLTAGGAHRQSLRTGVLKVTCAAPAAGTCRARAVVKLGKRRYRSRTAHASLTAGRRLTLVLRFARKDARALRAALRRHKLSATVTVTLTDGSGRTATARVTVRLRR